jgi:integrase
MAKVSGVGKERIISGNKYFPIYYRFNGRKVINTSVKADSKMDAHHQLEAMIKELHSKPKIAEGVAASLEVVREDLRRDVVGDFSNEKDSKYLVKNTFTRLFIDFPKKYYPGLSRCGNLPVGFFKRYKSYFCEDLNRATGLRAEIIRIKSLMPRIKHLGYCTAQDADQISEMPTPEGVARPIPKVSDAQIVKLLNYIKKDRADYYKPIKFMAMVGRRVKETCSITMKDVEGGFDNPLVIRTKPLTAKNKKALPPPIYLDDPELKGLIKSAMANNKTVWLFPSRHGKKITPNYIWKYLDDVVERVIGVRVTSHTLRKIFLTKANRGGLNKDSMDMANIKNVAVMMKHYVESTPEGQAKLLAKLRGDDV